jgi:hypothetical protein
MTAGFRASAISAFVLAHPSEPQQTAAAMTARLQTSIFEPPLGARDKHCPCHVGETPTHGIPGL